MTTPAKSWMRSFSPSRTLTCTRTASPGEKAGTPLLSVGFSMSSRRSVMTRLSQQQARKLTETANSTRRGPLPGNPALSPPARQAPPAAGASRSGRRWRVLSRARARRQRTIRRWSPESEDLRHCEAAELARARVMRIIQAFAAGRTRSRATRRRRRPPAPAARRPRSGRAPRPRRPEARSRRATPPRRRDRGPGRARRCPRSARRRAAGAPVGPGPRPGRGRALAPSGRHEDGPGPREPGRLAASLDRRRDDGRHHHHAGARRRRARRRPCGGGRGRTRGDR